MSSSPSAFGIERVSSTRPTGERWLDHPTPSGKVPMKTPGGVVRQKSFDEAIKLSLGCDLSDPELDN